MFCPKCGKQINDDDIFCAYCGESINDEQPTPPPQPVPPPSPYQNNPFANPAPNPPSGQPKRKSKGLIAAVVILSVLLLTAIGVVIFMIVKGDDDDDDEGSGKSKSSGASSSMSDEGNETESSMTTSSATTTTSETTTSETTTESTTTTTTETTTTSETTTTTSTTVTTTVPVQTTPPDNGLSDDTAAMNEAMFYSTNERPRFEEFEWCYGQNGLITTPPEGASAITNPLGFSGGWKAMIVYNDGSYMREIDNFNIMIDGSNASISVDWYYFEVPNSEPGYMGDSEDTLFNGVLSGNGIVVEGLAQITINEFWRADGKEYAVGSMYIPTGTSAYVALVRK